MMNLYSIITNSNSYKELSRNIHFLITILLLIQTVFVGTIRYFNFPILITYINLAEISVYLLSIFFFLNKKYTTSILITAYGIPIIFSFVILYFNFTLASTLWFLLGFEIIYILIFNNYRSRIIYATFCTLFFFVPGIFITYNNAEIIIKIVQILTLTIIPIIVAGFISEQEKKLQRLNRELENRYKEKEAYAEKLDEKNQELVVFTHIMSHDLKSPIQSINAFSQLLKKKLKNEKDKIQEIKFLNFIAQSANSMADLIDDLLLYSRIEQNDVGYEEVDLEPIVEKVLSSFQFDIVNHKVEIEIGDLPTIYGNGNILKTVFHNLISNSIKYQPKDNNHIPKINIWSESNDANNHIFIKDNGIGIDKTYLDNLFTPFKRFHTSSEYKGTGLGMSICKKVMQKHHGDITLVKTSNCGSLFKLSFPKIDKPIFEIN